MAADPVIVPPTPTITQPSSPGVDTSPGMDAVQRAFDTAYPDVVRTHSTPKAAEAPTEPVAPATKPPEPTTQPATQPAPPELQPLEHKEDKIPSFLEEALKLEPSQTVKPPAEPEVEWSDELPVEEKRSRVKGLRDAYNNLKKEVAQLKERPSRDPVEQQRLSWLEQQNKQMSEVLSRVGVEHSVEFQKNVMAPLTASWNEAARIVRDAGGDPQELAKAMSLNGRAQFEALDGLFGELPESAKMEAHDALRNYRRFEDMRRAAIQNAPKTLENLRARETQRQYAEITKQRQDMQGMFERALTRLRDEAKVEIFQKFDKPEAKWWNDQQEQIVAQGSNLFLENTDMDKVAMACLLAPAANAYRQLFIKAQKRVAELEKRFNNEPNLSESTGGSDRPPEQQIKDDLKKPFTDVFLREFHRAQARSR